MTHYQKNESGILVPFAPHITKRSYIEGEVGSRASMEGLYQLTVRRADGSVKQQTPWFKNLILNQGLNRLGTNGIWGICEIGTGTAAAAESQTSLAGLGGRTSNVVTAANYAQSNSPFFYSRSVTYRFSLGALDGNYTEIGVGWADGVLFSRALITPDGVNPSAITVLADEQLDVSYTLRVYPPSESDWGAGTYTISGTNYQVLGRLSYGSSLSVFGIGTTPFSPVGGFIYGGLAFSGPVGAITGGPAGYGENMSGYGDSAYVSNSYTRTSMVTAGLTAANVSGGIRSVVVFSALGYTAQYQFTPAIPKDPTKTLNLTFSCSWARRP